MSNLKCVCLASQQVERVPMSKKRRIRGIVSGWGDHKKKNCIRNRIKQKDVETEEDAWNRELLGRL